MLRIAEHECPWGEMAENYRVAALAGVIQAMASDSDGAARSAARANSLFATLFDPAPPGKR